MAHATKGISRMDNQMVGVDSFIQKETFMKAISLIIMLMAMEYISIRMEAHTKATGQKTNIMEKELRHGMMVLLTKETI